MTHPIPVAFVLGAGLGTRLRPLTGVRPKPLLPIYGKPLITFALDHLGSVGVESFVINTHYLPAQFDETFASGEYAGRPVKLVYEPELLETGGGIRNAQPWIGNGPFIVYSGDVLTDIDLEALVAEHFDQGNDVTLALRDTGLASGVALENGRITDIGGRRGQPGRHDFANVSVWNADIFPRIPEGKKISFIPILTEWIGQGGKIGGLVLNDRQWFNIGSRTEYLATHRTIERDAWKPAWVRKQGWPVKVSPGATIAPSARLTGCNVIGENTVIGENAVIEDSILWPGARIADNAHLRGCVAAGSLLISGEYADVDFTASE